MNKQQLISFFKELSIGDLIKEDNMYFGIVISKNKENINIYWYGKDNEEANFKIYEEELGSSIYDIKKVV